MGIEPNNHIITGETLKPLSYKDLCGMQSEVICIYLFLYTYYMVDL